jgi:hypothetical protein
MLRHLLYVVRPWEKQIAEFGHCLSTGDPDLGETSSQKAHTNSVVCWKEYGVIGIGCLPMS